MDISAVCNNVTNYSMAGIFHIPLTRYELISPYPDFSQFQLDMRRKAEILQHKPKNINNLGNKFTQKQHYSRILNKNANKTEINCINDQYLHTPSYYSNVPGKAMNLYLDPNIPLYNYSRNILDRNFANSELPETENNSKWITTALSQNIISNNGSETSLFKMLINKAIDQSYYTYSMNIPISITINGTFPGVNIFQYFISTAVLKIYYGNQTVKTNINNYDISTTTDISYNFIVGVSNNFNNTLSNNTFSACKFLGNLQFNNIKLYTQPGYIYDFRLTVNITSSRTNLLSFHPTQLYSIINPNFDIFYDNNCTTTIQNNNQIFSNFSFEGI